MRYNSVAQNDFQTPFSELVKRKDHNFKKSLRNEKSPPAKKPCNPNSAIQEQIKGQVNRYFKKVRLSADQKLRKDKLDETLGYFEQEN